MGHKQACRYIPLLQGTLALHPPIALWADTCSLPTPLRTSLLCDKFSIMSLNCYGKQENAFGMIKPNTGHTFSGTIFWWMWNLHKVKKKKKVAIKSTISLF